MPGVGRVRSTGSKSRIRTSGPSPKPGMRCSRCSSRGSGGSFGTMRSSQARASSRSESATSSGMSSRTAATSGSKFIAGKGIGPRPAAADPLAPLSPCDPMPDGKISIRREGGPVDRQQVQALFDMTGRVVIATGGTRGIGWAVAQGYAAAGASVVVASRKEEACRQAETVLRAGGAQALGVPTHMGDLADLERVVGATVEAFGGVDVVGNNA